jgi:hypothetical protein
MGSHSGRWRGVVLSYRMIRRLHVAVFAAAVLTGGSAAAQDEVFLFDQDNAMPERVRALMACEYDPGDFGTRRPFANGFVFASRCPGNNENEIQSLVYAVSEDGAIARLLRFPHPGQKGPNNPAASIANARYDPAAREIGEIAVDRESPICRTEGRWRLVGRELRPELVFWRETRDCDGKRGWSVVVDKSRRK